MEVHVCIWEGSSARSEKEQNGGFLKSWLPYPAGAFTWQVKELTFTSTLSFLICKVRIMNASTFFIEYSDNELIYVKCLEQCQQTVSTTLIA